jgi:cephalosporin hydroxylase
VTSTRTVEHVLPRTQATVTRPEQFPKPGPLIAVIQKALRAYNAARRLTASTRLEDARFRELQEVRQLAVQPNDINEHLETMFVESLLLRPKLIVELGVRSGVSTFVFERAARVCNASLISVDLDDCSKVSAYPRWYFFQGDDVQFAAQFQDFCQRHGIVASIDLLFVDTSHYYEHTIEEIRAWFPQLSARARVLFHDTNCRYIGKRKDGCFELAWDNRRGVIQAIEEYLGIRIDERKEGFHYSRNWLVRHTPYCNGLTILDRVAV